jgi:hypothetical protein
MNGRLSEYHRGVEDVLRLAEQAAHALENSPLHQTRRDFAIEALLGLAEHGRALIEQERDDQQDRGAL